MFVVGFACVAVQCVWVIETGEECLFVGLLLHTIRLQHTRRCVVVVRYNTYMSRVYKEVCCCDFSKGST